MSALGQKQTFAPQKIMSALSPKADIARLKTYCARPRLFLGRRYSVGELAKYGLGLHQPRFASAFGRHSSSERYWQSQYSP
jgi:hypothetical protein